MEGFPSSPLNEKLDAGTMRRAEFGPIWLDLKTQSLRVAGSDISEDLRPQEYQMLWLLIRSQGNLITASDFVQFLYEDDEEKDLPLSNVINQRMLSLRDKLERLTNGKVNIETIRDAGWRIELK